MFVEGPLFPASVPGPTRSVYSARRGSMGLPAMRSREDEAPRLPAVPDSDTDSIADADREPVPHTYGKSDADTDPQPVTIALTYGEPNSDRGRITVTYSEPDAYGLPDTITVTDTHGKSRTYTHGPTLIQWWQRLGIATRRQL